MLTSIKVTGFRALQSLEAKDFGRVNLLVGKNNAPTIGLRPLSVNGSAMSGQPVVELQ